MNFSIHHIAITVSDLSKSVAFYENLGFLVTKRFTKPSSGFEAVFLTLGVQCLELLHYVDEQGWQYSQTPPEQQRREIGIKHIAFGVADIEAAVSSLRERGVQIPTPRIGASGHRYVHFFDPDGIELELFQLGEG